MPREKDTNWNVGTSSSVDHAQLAVLMDIRDELKSLNRVLHCLDFQSMPGSLRLTREATERIDKRLRQKFPLRRAKP